MFCWHDLALLFRSVTNHLILRIVRRGIGRGRFRRGLCRGSFGLLRLLDGHGLCAAFLTGLL